MTADAVGGVWSYALTLSRGLASEGTRIILATMGPRPSPAQRRDASTIPGLVLIESDFALEWMPGAERDRSGAADWLLGLERRYRPDLVHLNGYGEGALPWDVPSVVVAHSCVVTWWRAVHGEDPPGEWDGYRARVAAGLRGADRLVGLTQAHATALQEAYGIEQVTVVPNGCDRAFFASSTKEPLVLASGRLWDEAKNLAVLDEAAASLPWPVMIAGDARAPDGRLFQPRHARLLGALPQRELAGWMARASIYAAPARYEPFGLGILEAALSGCALVLGDIPTLRELWYDAAAFVPPTDPLACRAALDALIRSEKMRASLGEAARRRALEYPVERMIAGYRQIYRDALSGSRRRPPLPLSA